jgi:hypothetical protein
MKAGNKSALASKVITMSIQEMEDRWMVAYIDPDANGFHVQTVWKDQPEDNQCVDGVCSLDSLVTCKKCLKLIQDKRAVVS